jgi:hypothetical protein
MAPRPMDGDDSEQSQHTAGDGIAPSGRRSRWLELTKNHFREKWFEWISAVGIGLLLAWLALESDEKLGKLVTIAARWDGSVQPEHTAPPPYVKLPPYVITPWLAPPAAPTPSSIGAAPSTGAVSPSTSKPASSPPGPVVVPPVSRGDALQAALNQWRLLGVRADPESLRILRTVTASDDAHLTQTNAAAWPEIQAAADVLNAPKLGLSPSTVARLPIYVKSLQQNPLEQILAARMTERLNAAGFAHADERHAAVIFFVEPPVFEDVGNYTLGDQEFWGESVKLTTYGEYNINSEQFVPRTQSPGHRNSSTRTTQDDLKGCALLDAGNLAVDKFIGMVGIPLPPSITC